MLLFFSFLTKDDSCILILDSETVLRNSGKAKDVPVESQMVSVPRLMGELLTHFCSCLCGLPFSLSILISLLFFQDVLSLGYVYLVFMACLAENNVVLSMGNVSKCK